jgi:DNA-binding transcriptional MocR family regulator
MSYKIDLSTFTRDGKVSLTQQLVDRFATAIDSGELEPGEKLPPTRELAAEVGVNHLTAARVYRRLAEQGYVTAKVGRGTFVRSLAPAGIEEYGDDWQVYALPEYDIRYPERVLAEAFASAGDPDLISLALGWPSPRLYPTEELARITADVFAEEGGEALSYLSAEGLYELREQLALRGREAGFADSPDEIVVTSGAKQALSLTARATLEEGDVAVIESPTFVGMLDSLHHTGARVIGVPVDEDGLDVDALERLLARHEVKLVALQTACQNPTGRNISEERRQRIAQLAMERNFFVLEDRVYADSSFEGEPPRPLRELAPAHVIYVNSLSKSVGGGLRAGWVAARGPVRERIAMLKLENDFHSPTLIQHMAARWLAPSSRRVPGGRSHRRPPPVGDPQASGGRARALLGIRPPGRDVHARRSGDRRAPVADRDAPVVLTARSTRARRGRAAPGAGDPRGAASQPHGGGRADVVSQRRSHMAPSRRSSSRE